MKKLFILLAMVGACMLATSCDEVTLDNENDNSTELPEDNNSKHPLESLNSITWRGYGITTSTEGSFISAHFKIIPKQCAEYIAENWEEHIKVQATYDKDKAGKLIDLPVTEVELGESGFITVTASGENLSEDFFSGIQNAFTKLVVTYNDKKYETAFYQIEIEKWFSETLPTPKANEIYYQADTVLTVLNTEFESNTYDVTTGCYKIVFKGENPELGERAFAVYNPSKLKGIAIGDNIKKIGDKAFLGCQNLNTCLLGNGVTEIGMRAFYYCESLKTITIPDGVTEINDWTFCSCGIKNIVIPDGVTTIGEGAFSGCSDLASVSIPESVTEIGVSAFANCKKIQSIVIPNGVTKISSKTFSRCSELQNISIPDGVTSIGESAFEQCESLNTITIPESVTEIGKRAFQKSGLTGITIPNRVQYIGEGAFTSCTGIENITIPSSVTEIGYNAFYGCSVNKLVMNSSIIETDFTWGATIDWSNNFQFEELIIGSNVTRIGNYAFAECNSLTSVTIPEGVTTIGDGAFYGCSNLTSVVIPEGVTEIGNEVFMDCVNLTNITIPKSVVSIGNNVFQYCI